MKYIILAFLLFPVVSYAGTMADTSFAMVNSIVMNQSVLTNGYQVTVLKANSVSRFLADGKLIPTADVMYVLVDVPLSTAIGTKLDSLKTFSNLCQAAGGVYVFMKDGALIPGRFYIRRDLAVAFLKSLVP